MTTDLEQKWIDSWLKLANYLSDEKLDGKTIFTLSFQNGCNFIVHPEGENGNTLDLNLCFNIPNISSSLPIHKISSCCNGPMSHTIESTKEGKLHNWICKKCGKNNPKLESWI